jgi:hypothetical protein
MSIAVCPDCGGPASLIYAKDAGRFVHCPCGGKVPVISDDRAAAVPAAPGQPLTVAQAAKAENCSTKTILRICRSGVLGEDGAWKLGTRDWRIDPAKLRAHRAKGSGPRPSRTSHPRNAGRTGASKSSNAQAWPGVESGR